MNVMKTTLSLLTVVFGKLQAAVKNQINLRNIYLIKNIIKEMLDSSVHTYDEIQRKEYLLTRKTLKE